jgi:hypothetical protein
MALETKTEVDTKPSKDAESIKTNLTINWEGMSQEDIVALAQQALVVKLQGAWRKNGIPNGDFTVNATDYKVGTRAARKPADLATMIAALSPEEKAALLARLTA